MRPLDEAVARLFEENRPHMISVASRILGSRHDAEDAVQEAWIRLSRTGSENIENLAGWLTTVVSRVCLDELRSRKARREEMLDSHAPGAVNSASPKDNPERDALLGEGVGMALQAVLDQLDPAERVAFVLHDVFDMQFEEVARIVDRSPAATRQMASRARRRVHPPHTLAAARERHQVLVAAFLDAARTGNLEAILALLHPDAVVRADAAATAMGAAAEVKGAHAVAETFKGRAQVARLAMAYGDAALVWAPGGQTRVLFLFTIRDGLITNIELIADAESIAGAELQVSE